MKANKIIKNTEVRVQVKEGYSGELKTPPMSNHL